MAVDLHLHSTSSDGSDTPTRIVELAVEAGLSTIALTDHDTLEGLDEAIPAAEKAGLELIPGIELALNFDGGMHLLVLWLQPGPGPLQDRLAEQRRGRHERNLRVLEVLAKHGIHISAEELAEEAGGGSVGRPHIAALMMAKGHVPDIATAFDRWLARDRPAYVSRPRLDPAEAIALARESGAVPVLAHPHTLGIQRTELSSLLYELKGYGLAGLEAIYSTYSEHERRDYAQLARRFDLIPSGGSDYHGTYKPGLDLGIGYGDLVVSDEVVEELREEARK